MDRYTYIHSRIWLDEKFADLQPDSKMLFLYLMTSPHCNMAGYYRLPLLYAAADLRMTPEAVESALDPLLSEGMVLYDTKAFVVLIPNYLKYNQLQNLNQAKGALAVVGKLPTNSLGSAFLKAIQTHAPGHLELFAPLVKGVTEALTQAPSVRVTETLTQLVTQDTEYRVQSTEYKDKHSPPSDDADGVRVASPVDNSREEPSKPVPLATNGTHASILERWNAARAITHKALSREAEKALRGLLKTRSPDEICLAIDRYATALHDPDYFYEHRWTLEKFLKQKNGFLEWLDGGQQWENYRQRQRAPTKRRDKPRPTGGIHDSGLAELLDDPRIYRAQPPMTGGGG